MWCSAPPPSPSEDDKELIPFLEGSVQISSAREHQQYYYIVMNVEFSSEQTERS